MNEYLQFFGYFASAIIALSMAMNSIVKFRWINLVGASSFALYGALIGAWPVLLLNGLIVGLDIFYLSRIYFKEELFDIIEIQSNNEYMSKFLHFHEKEIHKFFPDFIFNPEESSLHFFVLRNTAVAGIFLGKRLENEGLQVNLDFVIPQYRDYKNGKYIYHRLKERFLKAGYKKIQINPQSEIYNNYLLKMGFSLNGGGKYEIRMDL